MLSNRPYLLRAFYQWIVDSGCTPILVIDATNARCKIPLEHVEDGEIVFNISSTAVRDLKMSNDSVEFKASFSGVVHVVYAPMKAILAVYAEENNEGLFFDANEEMGSDDDNEMTLSAVETSYSEQNKQKDNNDKNDVPKNNKKPPFLKLVE